MDLTAIQTEVRARGFDYETTTTRLNYWINRAYTRIAEADNWTWLRATASGTAPLTISDLRRVVTVVDSTNDTVLHHLPEQVLLDFDGDLTTTGTPEYWYRSSDTAISVYPANTTNTISVVYRKNPTALSAGGDTPVVPTRYHYLIVDGAVIEALKDSDNISEASAIEASFKDVLQEMRIANSHGPDYQVTVGQNY